MHTTDIAAGRGTSGASPGIKKHFKRKPRNHDTDNRSGSLCSFDTLGFLGPLVFFIKGIEVANPLDSFWWLKMGSGLEAGAHFKKDFIEYYKKKINKGVIQQVTIGYITEVLLKIR